MAIERSFGDPRVSAIGRFPDRTWTVFDALTPPRDLVADLAGGLRATYAPELDAALPDFFAEIVSRLEGHDDR